MAVEGVYPSGGTLGWVCRAHQVVVGDGAQRPVVLHRLMGGPIFAEQNAVVGEHEHALQV